MAHAAAAAAASHLLLPACRSGHGRVVLPVAVLCTFGILTGKFAKLMSCEVSAVRAASVPVCRGCCTLMGCLPHLSALPACGIQSQTAFFVL